MAGDGVNEALALIKAHVGIALDSGTEVVTNGAQVTLFRRVLRAATAHGRAAVAAGPVCRCVAEWFRGESGAPG